ncbi:Hypothetical_protein [Hexamita inflata]|uniref:Hypothetical_protein n=1 Tax=Hexamita inflata TaxID=28002 RepID=A0AA86PHD7_9EUKA|nr:Hypothetical protein HINF_LOCUS27245 [Hexamita inflata]
MYLQITLNVCTTDICCQIENINTHYIQGECRTCQEIYNYQKQVCTTCKAQFGEWSYYMNGNCFCGGGSAGTNTYCDDCWGRKMIVYNEQCVQCSKFDENAYYDTKNYCACVKGLRFIDFKCKYYISFQTRVVIISIIVTILLLASIFIFIVFKRRKMNLFEFKAKNQKLDQQKLNLITNLNQTETKMTTRNKIIISEDIQNMNQIIQEILITQIDEIKENDVYLYKE